jgi:hypothetical protein
VPDIVGPDSPSAEEYVDPDDRPNLRRIAKKRPPSPDRRRFVIAATVGLCAALIPYLWILWDFWDGLPNPLRATVPGATFYDQQARAMFHGKLSVPTGALNIEGFVHDGRTYTYFGIFPSLIRMPILLLTHHFDGRLTAPSMLAAWLVAGVFCALLVWRIRILMRGPVELGRMEVASYGLLLATMMGGSEWIFLASDTWVYHEDLAWSIALVIGSAFTLLGVLEKPTWRRVVASAVFVLCASLNRLPTGYACIIGALLVTAWFALGRGGPERRRWVLWTSLAWFVPIVVVTIFNEAKFGVPFGVPLSEQVFSSVNAHRRLVLASSGGKGLGPQYLPSALWAYMQPGGIRLTPIFPYITLPATTARVIGGAIFDRTDRTASIPASMPLLFLLSCWGLVATFRRQPLGRGNLLRIILVATAACCASVLILDYISNRYLGDFLPFLLAASAIGMVDLWGRTFNWRRRARRVMVVVLAMLTLASIAINLGIASTPQDNWSRDRVVNYVNKQVDMANLTGVSLAENIEHGRTLPYYAPADKLFIVGKCRALYLSNGESYQAFPSQQVEHRTWTPLLRPASYQHWFSFTLKTQHIRLAQPIPIMTIGKTTILMATQGRGHVVFDLAKPHGFVRGRYVRLRKGRTYRVIVMADPNLQSLTVSIHSSSSLVAVLPPGQPKDVPLSSPIRTPLPFTLAPRTPTNQNRALCKSVLHAG